MKRITIILSLVLMSGFVAIAQNETSDQLKRQLVEASGKIETIECDFVQTKTVSLLDDEMVSSGRMSFERPGSLTWEYVSPSAFSFAIKGNDATFTRDGKTEQFNVNQSKMIKEIARMIMSSITGNSISDGSMFDTVVEDSGAEWIATLMPKKNDLKKMWTKLVLHYDSQKRSATAIELHESSGDLTLIEFKNIKVNGK